MTRKPCLHVPGGLYHVILRGNARQYIFFRAEDHIRFYELIEEGVSRFGYWVHAFCLMTNHLHLALQRRRAIPVRRHAEPRLPLYPSRQNAGGPAIMMSTCAPANAVTAGPPPL